MAPAGYEHGRVTMNLSWRIMQHVRPRKLGVVLTADTGFIIKRDPDTCVPRTSPSSRRHGRMRRVRYAAISPAHQTLP